MSSVFIRLASPSMLSWSLLSIYAMSEVWCTPLCEWNQIAILTKNKTLCRDCPKCAIGMGLSPQCGSYVNEGTKIKCVSCAAGKTYSDSHDVSSCRPCSICGANEQTLRKCTAKMNSECGKCKQGYYRSIAHDCWPCTKCCPNSTNNELVQECLDQGLSRDHSCRLDTRTMDCTTTRRPTSSKRVITSDQSVNGTQLPSGSAHVARVFSAPVSHKTVLILIIVMLALILLLAAGLLMFYVGKGTKCISVPSTKYSGPFLVRVTDHETSPAPSHPVVYYQKHYLDTSTCSEV